MQLENFYEYYILVCKIIFIHSHYILSFNSKFLVILIVGGYKGYGLGFMVELFCGIMSGSAFGPHIRSWNKSDVDADLVSTVGFAHF